MSWHSPAILSKVQKGLYMMVAEVLLCILPIMKQIVLTIVIKFESYYFILDEFYIVELW